MNGQMQLETRPTQFAGSNFHLSTMRFNNSAHKIQAQSAARDVGVNVTAPVKRFKDVGGICSGNSRPVIGNAEYNIVSFANRADLYLRHRTARISMHY